jgi:Peptidase family C25
LAASLKLSITCRTRLQAKYDNNSLARIDSAVADWISADQARGIRTIHVALDDPKAMKPYKVRAITGRITANKVKKVLDALASRLNPDYIVLFGAADVVPVFSVANPTHAEDQEPTVLTDNPYASSQPFSSRRRASYLIPDRVLGRIPDLVASNDPRWFVNYLAAATRSAAQSSKRYAKGLLVCCDSWKKAGRECVSFIARDAKALMVSPPTGDESQAIRSRHSTRLHMIKCHGAAADSRFYGQRGNSYPPVLHSTSLLRRTKSGTVIGAMCCYGASVFDVNDPANVSPGDPPIPSVYLEQGALGFLGSTTTAWVGPDTMMCADWIVAAFLKASLGGASLGRATLESKQDFVRWTHQQGNELDGADEKTLLQFVLLGDPSIHPVKATSPAELVSASLLGASSHSAAAMARAERRRARRRMGELLRAEIPTLKPSRSTKIPPNIRAFAKKVAATTLGGADLSRPRVERLEPRAERPTRPQIAGRRASAVRPSKLQYYWTSARVRGPVRDIRMVSIQADAKGNVLRSHALASS